MEEHSHLLNTIFIGEVATVQSYGAFVRIPGISKQGLIHRSQVSSAHVDDVSEVLSRKDKVYCKVISVTDGKIALSMKHVNQGSGKDLDPNGVQFQKDEQQRRTFVPNSRKKIELEAVLNTTCSKCGTRGHMSRDCFKSPDGKTYDLLPENDSDEGVHAEAQQDSVPETTGKKVKKKKKEKKTKLCKEKKKKKVKKKKKRRSSHSSDESSSKDSSNSESETESRKKIRKRRHSSSSSDSDNHKKRRHSDIKKKKKNFK